MAHIGCVCGKDLWNGDGKPVIWAFRLNYLKQIVIKDPYVIWASSDSDYYILDEYIFENYEEDLDIWFCDSCHSFSVFYGVGKDEERLNYRPSLSNLPNENEKWEEYIVFRDTEFEDFDNEAEDRLLSDILEHYHFKRTCKVSPDKRLINYYENGIHAGSFSLADSIKFIYTTEDNTGLYDINYDTSVNLFHFKPDDNLYSSRSYNNKGEMIGEEIIRRSDFRSISEISTKHTYIDVIYEDDCDGVWSYSPGELSLRVGDRVIVSRTDEYVIARVIEIEDRNDYEARIPYRKLKQIIDIIDEDNDKEIITEKLPDREKLFYKEFGISPFDVLSHRTYNRDELRKSNKCCCYQCGKIYDVNEIHEWLERDAEETAICPYCKGSFVLGDHSGLSVDNQKFVDMLKQYWFSK